MNNKQSSKKKIKYIVLIIAVALIGTILACAFSMLISTGGKRVVRNEIMYFILAALILLPIMLIIFLMALVFGKKKIEETDSSVEINGSLKAIGKGIKKGKVDKEEENGERTRFYMLSEIDARSVKYQKEQYETEVTLKEFCEGFRNFASYKLQLYYSIEDIRRFVAGLAVSKIVILQGMSGTGKTSLAYALGDYIGNPSTVVPVQPMWKERTDLIGYYNEFTKKFNETVLLQKMYEANYSRSMYVTILDELNIARVEYYFAEFLSLLEIASPERRHLDIVTDEWANDPIQLRGGQMRLPNNMWFIGTANNDDSTFAISDKVYDRAMIMNLDNKCEPFKAPKTKEKKITAEKFFELAKEAIEEYPITNRNLNRLEKLDRYMIKTFNITFGNRIMKQIQQYIPIYVACGGEELDALDDILSKKVLRKLETQNPVYIRSVVDSFCEYLDELFGVNKMKLCKDYVQRIKKNV